ncbi:MAG TPA: FkbM family methyltransferase [Fusibacter sp.]|nr:FkbM family methyltransferase [Fusibacter sp.]
MFTPQLSNKKTIFHKILKQVRPASFQNILINLLCGSAEKRRISILNEETGLEYWIDPFSNLGQSLLAKKTYEPETQKIIENSLKAGNICIDVGANEGYFTCLMAKIVGDKGTVFAIEPQLRLLPLIFRNLNENLLFNAVICNFCLSDKPAEKLSINLWPEINTGASSVARRYRWSSRSQEIHAFNLDFFLEKRNIEKVDFVKIDVEGYEHEVICGMRDSLETGKIKILAVDYHKNILGNRGLNSLDIHEIIQEHGYKTTGKDFALGNYAVYYRNP